MVGWRQTRERDRSPGFRTRRAGLLLGAVIVGLGTCFPGRAEEPGIAPVALTSTDCLFCHGKGPGAPTREGVVIDVDKWNRSVHAGRIQCHDCHVGVTTDVKQGHDRAREPVDCKRCHGPRPSRVPPEYRGRSDSIHQRVRSRDTARVPTCKYCHGTHDILPPESPESRVNRVNIRKTCGECHAQPNTFRGQAAPQTAVEFDRSIHGRPQGEPGVVAATCTDCHRPHHPSEPASTHPIRKRDIPAICGACHKRIYAEYRTTIHGRELAKGNQDVPACTDCHGEHNIRAPQEQLSSVNPRHIVQTCTKCHDNKQLQRRYGLPADRTGTYRRSYHGISNRFGDIRAANCATCHTAHHILPSSDPDSSVNPANLKRTCGKPGCHKGVSDRFRLGPVHLAATADSESLVYWVGVFYKLLIVALVAFFCLSILLDVSKRVVLRLTERGDR